MEIKHIDYGTGNRVGDMIYINKNLKKYPNLYKAVLEHEKKHSGSFGLSDAHLDFRNEDLREHRREWFKFLIKHPRAWVNFLPVMKLGGRWTVDVSILFVWILMVVLLLIMVLII